LLAGKQAAPSNMARTEKDGRHAAGAALQVSLQVSLLRYDAPPMTPVTSMHPVSRRSSSSSSHSADNGRGFLTSRPL